MTNPLKLSRRETMLSLLAVATTGLVACKDQQSNSEIKEAVAGYKVGDPFLNGSEMALLTSIAGLIIPQTDTPGAVEAGVHDTIQNLLSNWGEDDVRTHWRNGLKAVSDQFKTMGASGSFSELGSDDQVKWLTELDAGVYKDSIDLPFYKDLKRTIATAYYMSEPGATQELAYDPVPGDFKGCIDYSEVGKAWAT